MWAEEGMDGSGNQENLRSGLAVGVPSIRQVPSSRLHRDELWPAQSPAHPPFLTRERGIDSFKIKFKEGQLWRGQFFPPFGWRKVGYAALQRLGGGIPRTLPKREPSWGVGLVWRELGGAVVTLPPLWLLSWVRKNLETWLRWEFGRDEQEPKGGVRALGWQRAAPLVRPPSSQAPASKGSWDSPVPFPALLLPCCISSASSFSLLLRASVSPKKTVSFSGR